MEDRIRENPVGGLDFGSRARGRNSNETRDEEEICDFEETRILINHRPRLVRTTSSCVVPGQRCTSVSPSVQHLPKCRAWQWGGDPGVAGQDGRSHHEPMQDTRERGGRALLIMIQARTWSSSPPPSSVPTSSLSNTSE